MSSHLRVAVYTPLDSFLSCNIVTVVIPEHEGHGGRKHATYHCPKAVVSMHSVYVSYLNVMGEAG